MMKIETIKTINGADVYLCGPTTRMYVGRFEKPNTNPKSQYVFYPAYHTGIEGIHPPVFDMGFMLLMAAALFEFTYGEQR